jgi:NADH dehydrogenase
VPYTILSPNVFMEVWFPTVVGIPLQSGQPVSIVGEGNRKHTFVSSADVAAFALAAVENPASRNQQIFIGGPEALSWNDVVRITSKVVGRDLQTRNVSPQVGLPGVPAVVSGLLAGMDTYDSPLDMTATAQTYGVQLTPAEQVIRRLFT